MSFIPQTPFNPQTSARQAPDTEASPHRGREKAEDITPQPLQKLNAELEVRRRELIKSYERALEMITDVDLIASPQEFFIGTVVFEAKRRRREIHEYHLREGHYEEMLQTFNTNKLAKRRLQNEGKLAAPFA